MHTQHKCTHTHTNKQTQAQTYIKTCPQDNVKVDKVDNIYIYTNKEKVFTLMTMHVQIIVIELNN